MIAPWFSADPNAWLQRILAVHLDPENGSAYWLARQKEWGAELRESVQTVADLAQLPTMPQEDLLRFPVEHFVPRRFHEQKYRWITAQTGGTTGEPKTVVYLAEELQQAFGSFFAYVAQTRKFPFGASWLFVGPSGPHIIGKAASTMARAVGSPDPFGVDFDPRWTRRFDINSAGALRYREHIVEQALQVVARQSIEVLFTTPPLLQILAEQMREKDRDRIRGIHLGGMPVDAKTCEAFRERHFSNATLIPGYGNTLFGITLEIEPPQANSIDYYPPGPRLLIDVVEPQTTQSVGYNQAGQVLFHRLDESFMILNMLERDQAEKIAPSPPARELGFALDGIRDPQPMEALREVAQRGLY